MQAVLFVPLGHKKERSSMVQPTAVCLLLLLPAAFSGGTAPNLRQTAFAAPVLGTLPWTRDALRGLCRRGTAPVAPQCGARAEQREGLRMISERQPGWEGYVENSNEVPPTPL